MQRKRRSWPTQIPLPAFERIDVITVDNHSRYFVVVYCFNRSSRLRAEGFLRVTNHEINFTGNCFCGLGVIAYAKIPQRMSDARMMNNRV
jgi:hypothetical protein